MRKNGLDFLRGLAIILVLARHGFPESILQHIGWVGVDLFFVLSGFLISGLVFQEYLLTETADIKKFLLRRAYKIAPPFYFFILISVLLKYFVKHEHYENANLLSETFYLQNYFPGIWPHTWSIAVEVHFYLLFTCFAACTIHTRLISKKKIMIGLLLFLYLLFSGWRWFNAYQHSDQSTYLFFQTHLRVDGLLLGMLFAYLYYFTEAKQWLRENLKMVAVTAILLIAPPFIFDGGSLVMNTVGMSLLNISFGLLILMSLQPGFLSSPLRLKVVSLVFKAICLIGVTSYSIYIWHLMSLRAINTLMPGGHPLLYLVVAIAIGMVFYFLIEKPINNLKDSLLKTNTQNHKVGG